MSSLFLQKLHIKHESEIRKWEAMICKKSIKKLSTGHNVEV